jgi:hypothetical protein
MWLFWMKKLFLQLNKFRTGDRMYNWKNYVNEFKNTEVSDNKDKYSFGLSYTYLLRTGFFFTALLVLGGISLADSLKNHYNIKMTISILLILYAVISMIRTLAYRITLDREILKYGKHIIKLKEISSATLTIGRISASRVGRALEIISNDKKEYILNLNINHSIKFLKILENRIGKKFLINEEN